MGIKLRLIVMNFLQFFIWGSWLTSLGVYVGTPAVSGGLGFDGIQIASIFATMGIASLFMPALLGIVADRWINAERVLGICHLLGAVIMFALTRVTDYQTFYILMLLNTMVYMPTLSLSNSIAYTALDKAGLNSVDHFPPIRVWGTVGFIVAMWVVDLLGWKANEVQFYVGAVAALVLGVYAFTLPKAPPVKDKTKKKSLVASLGLDAFSLFKEKKMAIFFIFSMLLGAALQITNTWGQPFLSDFGSDPLFENAFAVRHSGILTSISQMSEALFILAIPFFLKRIGIKGVMLMSMGAWVLRFAFFGIGNPGSGLVFLILSMIVYGMAFDFFNVSGSLFVEQEAKHSIRSSAQGLFVLMTNGIGTILGTLGSGYVVDYFTNDGVKNWPVIWFIFAAYALVIGILFAILFRYKHNPKKAETAEIA